MKKTIFIIGLSICMFAGCKNTQKDKDGVSTDLIDVPQSASGVVSDSKLPNIKFEKDIHDFGRLTDGEKVSYSFKFSNTGKGDLIITQVKSSCGCTVTDFPKNVIKTGETGYITITFNSSGKHGQQFQTVTVSTNSQPSITELTIKAQVE